MRIKYSEPLNAILECMATAKFSRIFSDSDAAYSVIFTLMDMPIDRIADLMSNGAISNNDVAECLTKLFGEIHCAVEVILDNSRDFIVYFIGIDKLNSICHDLERIRDGLIDKCCNKE